MSLNTPVAVIVFRRPSHAAAVLAAIREQQPRQLFIIGDGPRPDRPGEAEQVAATRQAVADAVDWGCNLHTNYADTNMGLTRRITSGIDWVFQHVDRAIFFEEDEVADPTFFPFCEQLLKRYADDERVMSITGTNPILHYERAGASYHFSKYPIIWGFATWRRAWAHYRLQINDWHDDPATRAQIRATVNNAFHYKVVGNMFDAIVEDRQETWDYQWIYACLRHNGLTIIPTHNLVANIGFGEGGTFDVDPSDARANMPRTPLTFPLAHPHTVTADTTLDDRSLRAMTKLTRPGVWFKRAAYFLRKQLGG